MMRGRLNLFQVVMLRWRALHPYNALHVAWVAGAADRARLVAAIDAERGARGLTGLVLDRAHARYEYRGGPAASAVEFVAHEGGARAALVREVERQLNLGFAAEGGIDPMRFFVVEDAGGFWLGLAYDHFIAGGDAISLLLQAIVLRYGGRPHAGPAPSLYPPTFARLLRRRAGDFVRGLTALPSLVASCRRGVRPRYRDDRDSHNGFIEAPLGEAATATLLAKCKAWRVTFNDAVMAATLLAMVPVLPPRAPGRRRHELAIASIVNLRGELGPDAAQAFGQFLTSMRLSHPVPEGMSLRALAQDLNVASTRIKRRRQHLQTLLAIRYNGLVWSRLDDARRRRFYAKSYPMVAGVTTLNVDALWSAQGAPPSDYLRAVPTGPIAPLVVAATTAGGAVRLGVSYRRAAFDAGAAARIVANLIELLSAPP